MRITGNGAVSARAQAAGYPDPALSTAALALIAIGLVAVYSAGIMRAQSLYDSTGHFLARQSIAALLGFTCLWVAIRMPLRLLDRLAGPFGILTLVFLALVLVPSVGVEINGARRWLSLGPLGRFQPSEFARLSVVLLIAKYAAGHTERMASLSQVTKALVLPALFAGLILAQPDLDTGLMILVIGLTILFAAGIPWAYIIGFGLLGLACAAMWLRGFQIDRIVGFLDPWADPRGRGYHVIQGWTAMGSGGFFGKGLGGSVLKFGFLPEAHTDFILAVIGEEGGFIVTSIVVLLFGVIAWRGYKVALSQPTQFGRFIAVGITAMITIQALLNLMVVTGLAPTAGVPLPLVSYGGTSFVLTTASLGILLGLSRSLPGR